MILAGFDLETTGFYGAQDHIVEFSFQIWDGDTCILNETHYVNPGVPISNSEIHGITDDMVKDSMDELSALNMIESLFQSCYRFVIPVVIMNAAFDVTFYRHAMIYHYDLVPRDDYLIIDPMVIDKQFDKWRKGSRKLIDLCRHYGIKVTEGFHSAEVDVRASIRVVEQMMQQHPTLRNIPLEILHKYQIKWYEAQQRSLYDWFVKSNNDAAQSVTSGWPVTTGVISNA